MDRRTFLAAAVGLPALARRGRSAEEWLVRYLWSGAATATSARVTACLSRPVERVRVAVVAGRADWAAAVYTPPAIARPEDGNIISFALDGLKPGTTYHYAVEVDGRIVSESPAKFATFPTEPAEFTFCLASCATTGSDHPVFDAIGKQNPAMFLHMGDFHYLDIRPADRNRRLEGYAAVHASSTQRKLYRQVPVAYMWDDHDFLGSDSDGVAETPAQRDAHMLAIDDGTNADFATGGGMPIPVFQAAALDRKGSDKGGPFSHGTKPGRGQFGRMRVKDDGTKLQVEWTGMNADGEIVKGME